MSKSKHNPGFRSKSRLDIRCRDNAGFEPKEPQVSKSHFSVSRRVDETQLDNIYQALEGSNATFLMRRDGFEGQSSAAVSQLSSGEMRRNRDALAAGEVGVRELTDLIFTNVPRSL